MSGLKSIGATLVDEALVTQIAIANNRTAATANADDRLAALNYAVAVKFVLHSNYPKYITELSNDMLHDIDNYPRSLDAAYEVLQLRGPESTPRAVHQDGVAFANISSGNRGHRASVTGRDGQTHAHITCFGCNSQGHYRSQCPNVQEEVAGEGANEHVGYTFSQVVRRQSIISKWWILIDSQSTVNVFHNRALLRNIRRVGRRMYIHCNAGTQWTDQMGD